jgi:hypothetical protein
MHWRWEHRRRPPAVSVRVGPRDPQRASDEAAIVAGICLVAGLMLIIAAATVAAYWPVHP